MGQPFLRGREARGRPCRLQCRGQQDPGGALATRLGVGERGRREIRYCEKLQSAQLACASQRRVGVGLRCALVLSEERAKTPGTAIDCFGPESGVSSPMSRRGRGRRGLAAVARVWPKASFALGHDVKASPRSPSSEVSHRDAGSYDPSSAGGTPVVHHQGHQRHLADLQSPIMVRSSFRSCPIMSVPFEGYAAIPITLYRSLRYRVSHRMPYLSGGSCFVLRFV